DNIPEPGAAPAAGATFGFNNPAKPQALTPLIAPPALSPTNPPQDDPDPIQVVRGRPIHDQTKATNARYQAKLAGTVWANYQLAATEWPTKPVPADSDGVPFPGPLGATCAANAVMETYFQKAGVSCMS